VEVLEDLKFQKWTKNDNTICTLKEFYDNMMRRKIMEMSEISQGEWTKKMLKKEVEKIISDRLQEDVEKLEEVFVDTDEHIY
jgi:nickel-dependent lactate racemase